MGTIEPFYFEAGRRIQALRVKLGMTQEQLGRQLDPPVTRASIANFETGKQRILAHTLVQLADVFDIPITELLRPRHLAKRPMVGVVERELAQKLDLPDKQIKKLAAQLKGKGHRRKA